jgi:hypothetical protein
MDYYRRKKTANIQLHSELGRKMVIPKIYEPETMILENKADLLLIEN